MLAVLSLLFVLGAVVFAILGLVQADAVSLGFAGILAGCGISFAILSVLDEE